VFGRAAWNNGEALRDEVRDSSTSPLAFAPAFAAAATAGRPGSARNDSLPRFGPCHPERSGCRQAAAKSKDLMRNRWLAVEQHHIVSRGAGLPETPFSMVALGLRTSAIGEEAQVGTPCAT